MNPAYTARVISDLADTDNVLPAVITAIADGDFDKAGSHMTDDVVLYIRGPVRFSGSWSGRASVVHAMHKNFSSLSEQRPVVEASAVGGNVSAVLLQEDGRYKEDGEAYSYRVALWVSYVGTLINRIEEICVNV
jgi:ketosteroid isomerase-like protein